VPTSHISKIQERINLADETLPIIASPDPYSQKETSPNPYSQKEKNFN
jgi:hypothetical protein